MQGHVADITDGVLLDSFERDAVARGRIHAVAGLAVVTHSEQGFVSGFVRGGAATAYLVSVGWETHDWGVDLWDECTCPRGGMCQHAVALILTERRGAGAQAGGSDSWRATLGPVADLADEIVAQERPLALRFTVRSHEPFRWDRHAVSYTSVDVLPLTIGKRGKWIKTGAAWRDLAHPPSAKAADAVPEQRQALVAMYASWAEYGRFPPAEIDLGDFGAVWFHLELAGRTGVQLLNEHDRTDRVVVEREPAEFGLELARADGGGDGQSDDVVLAPRVTMGDFALRLPAKRAGLIGEHGAFWEDDAGVLHLARFASPLPSRVADLGSREPVTIPGADVEDFRAGTGMRLARVANVIALDPAIAPRTPEPPRLALHAAFHRNQGARLSWGYQYGDAPVEPLAFSDHHRRDRKAERQLLKDLSLDQLPALAQYLVGRYGEPLDATVSGNDLIDLVAVVVPWLEDRGVRVSYDDEFRLS